MANKEVLGKKSEFISTKVEKGDTTIYLEGTENFGDLSTPFLAIIDAESTDAEAVLVTACDSVANTITVERDMLGTSDVAHAKGSIIQEAGEKFVIGWKFADVSTNASEYITIPVDCVLLKGYSVLEGPIATADATLTLKNGSNAITNGVFTIAYNGSAAGDQDTITPTAYTEFSAGDKLEIDGGGESTNAVSADLTLLFATL